MPARFPLILAVLCLAGCAAAVPGYSPPPFKEKHKFASESGDLEGDGTYRMSEAENKLDCKHLTGSIYVIMTQLRAARDQVQPSGAATATQQTFGPLFGDSMRAVDPKVVDARLRAKLRAYNAQLAAKHCKTVDIEAEMAKPPEAPRKY
ncbi:MAG TPA: hypothetical protein VG900_05540 [Hyphomicrobiaceae bacterium]|jgi:hypothetical protein|nr:hypothetical protein [Hyphomicrobiaceae bacterium]